MHLREARADLIRGVESHNQIEHAGKIQLQERKRVRQVQADYGRVP